MSLLDIFVTFRTFLKLAPIFVLKVWDKFEIPTVSQYWSLEGTGKTLCEQNNLRKSIVEKVKKLRKVLLLEAKLEIRLTLRSI